MLTAFLPSLKVKRGACMHVCIFISVYLCAWELYRLYKGEMKKREKSNECSSNIVSGPFSWKKVSAIKI